MQNRTYGDLFKLIQSLAGVGSFSTDEQSDVANFINRRFFEAFQTSQSWTRYIVVGEERTVGTSPAQTIPFTEASKDTIGEFIRIHRKQPFLNNSAVEYDFYVDASGAHILNQNATTEGTAFVTYKKVFSALSTSSAYTTSTEEVPAEFFHYIAHASYADFLRMDGQTSKAITEEQIAGNYLALELEKVDIQMNNSTVNKKFRTYVNNQAR